jgi:uncharacterized membrane protein YbjE (DUF340 family)
MELLRSGVGLSVLIYHEVWVSREEINLCRGLSSLPRYEPLKTLAQTSIYDRHYSLTGVRHYYGENPPFEGAPEKSHSKGVYGSNFSADSVHGITDRNEYINNPEPVHYWSLCGFICCSHHYGKCSGRGGHGENTGDFMIVMIVCALIMGVFLGFSGVIPESALGGVAFGSRWLLIALLFLVGMDVGCNKEVLRDLRKMGVKILVLPLAITAGSLLGGVAVSLLQDVTIYESLAVASGMGYYTLSSIILTQAVGSTLGTLAFLSNIFREILTVITCPVLARISRLAPVASGGATSMDTTLPVIIQCTSKTVGILAVISGVVITLLVPFLVSFFAHFIG